MYYYSGRRVNYVKITLLHGLLFVFLGPIAAVGFGLIEFAAAYLLILTVTPNALSIAMFHAGYIIIGLILFSPMMKLRRYHIVSKNEARGRFNKKAHIVALVDLSTHVDFDILMK